MNYRALTAAAMTVLIGGGLWLYETPEEPAPVEKNFEESSQENHGVGIIDIEKIYAIHPEGEHLNELIATELRLRLELNEAMKIVNVPKPPAPETNIEVFDEAAWQKNAQRVISQLAELEGRRKRAAEEYRKKSEPDYIKERDKISEGYLNENMNIQLKLRNRDNLHLTQEQINDLLKRLDEVELERNAKQGELLEKWKAEVLKYANDSVAEDEARLKAESDKLRAEMEAQAHKKESDVTERNQKLMADAVKEMESRQNRRRELLTQLQEVSNERAELERKILDSISDKAIMLAAVNRLEMVLVSRKSAQDEKFSLRPIVWNFELKSPKHTGAVIIAGKDARDLTEELIKEIKRL